MNPRVNDFMRWLSDEWYLVSHWGKHDAGAKGESFHIRPGRTKDTQPVSTRLKRAYEAPAPGDGFRILVDRLWPRGVPRDAARIDLWFKDIAPSASLRTWFGHEPAKWPEFKERYFAELDDNPEAVERLQGHMRQGTVTLVYGAKDKEHNHALALLEYLGTIRPRS